jgi:hypothetical protein
MPRAADDKAISIAGTKLNPCSSGFELARSLNQRRIEAEVLETSERPIPEFVVTHGADKDWIVSEALCMS